MNIMNKKLIRLTEQDLHRMVKESVEKILDEANFFSGLRRAWNMGKTTDYLLDKDERRVTQRGVDIDRARTGSNGQNLGLSGYHTKRDARLKQADIDKMERERQSRINRLQQSSYQQPTQAPKDIYSQTVEALNDNRSSFFSGRKDLQGVLMSLYNSNKITYNEYEKGLQWIGRGYRYSSGQRDGLY